MLHSLCRSSNSTIAGHHHHHHHHHLRLMADATGHAASLFVFRGFLGRELLLKPNLSSDRLALRFAAGVNFGRKGFSIESVHLG
ncbi:hypothetical protein RchiOBHm_Chr3g0475231 [Rosa chinensis]|uniref:Uncharacterized protein n=1 Tax=Rosa chinensis TaxID=74649 RepID=A0A2P6RCB5_ROSCH|nr:hypothetical protein RchiOBHm_Chr3g0475231 [Rosa chinensis]